MSLALISTALDMMRFTSLMMGASAVAGVLIGINLQQKINEMWGDAGSNLYVSFAFVVVLVTVGGYVYYDAWKISYQVDTNEPRPNWILAGPSTEFSCTAFETIHFFSRWH